MLNDNYSIKIKSNNDHEMNLTISIMKNNLFLNCFYYDDYFEVYFKKEYSLEELKKKSNYYKQFNNIKEFLEEIKNNGFKGQERINEEENQNVISLKIPVTSNTYKYLEFELLKIEKSKEELFEEYKQVVKIFKSKSQLCHFNSKIVLRTEQKELLKLWITDSLKINYIDKLKAKLLYSFYGAKKEEKEKYGEKAVKEFHDKCDNKPSILVICSSGKQIFGGYTPLKFLSNNSYGSDKDHKNSFIFSLNKLEKYKNEGSNSIWCYKEYGPCFNYDLEFIQKKMNVVNIYKYSYNLPNNFLVKENDIIKKNNSSEIFLDSLEIFQIIQDINEIKKN